MATTNGLPIEATDKASKKKSFKVGREHAYVCYDYVMVRATSAEEATQIAERDEGKLKWIDAEPLEWADTKFLDAEEDD
jgi:hypothetical protein